MKPYKGLVKIYCDLHKCKFGKKRMDSDCINCRDYSKSAVVGLSDEVLAKVAKEKEKTTRKKVR